MFGAVTSAISGDIYTGHAIAVLDFAVGTNLRLAGFVTKKGMLNDFAIHIDSWESPVKLVHNMTGTLIGMAHIMLPFLVLPL